jgi:hypothetical protein
MLPAELTCEPVLVAEALSLPPEVAWADRTTTSCDEADDAAEYTEGPGASDPRLIRIGAGVGA